MKKSFITDYLIQYTFEPIGNRHFGFNLFALIAQDKVLLIETGYEKHALAVLDDLKKENYTIEKIIITHYHDDHIYGLKVLPKVDLVGNKNFQKTLHFWTNPQDHFYFKPNILIEEETTINFYQHKIQLIPFPGHSICGMLIILNDEFCFVGDEIMLSNEGYPILPSVDLIEEHSLERHLNSLKKLKNYAGYILIPSHGTYIDNKTDLLSDLENRISYFQTIINNPEKITYEEATKNCKKEFLHKEWFKGVYNE